MGMLQHLLLQRFQVHASGTNHQPWFSEYKDINNNKKQMDILLEVILAIRL